MERLVSEMTYNVLMRTLNFTHSLSHEIGLEVFMLFFVFL